MANTTYLSSSSFLAGLSLVSWFERGHRAGLRHYGHCHCPGLTPHPLVRGPRHSEKHTAHSPMAVKKANLILLPSPGLWFLSFFLHRPHVWTPRPMTYLFLMCSKQGGATHRASLVPPTYFSNAQLSPLVSIFPNTQLTTPFHPFFSIYT